MKVTASKTRAAVHRRNVPEAQRDTGQDHDLPILATEERTVGESPDWETLLAAGVQPAQALGAERRWQGRR